MSRNVTARSEGKDAMAKHAYDKEITASPLSSATTSRW